MSEGEQNPVRTFVSYSWTSPAHETWVLDLATRLRADGVDVVLDKWDLKPGHDAYKFMEQMVTDATVTKVVMICDAAYAEKANARAGGVGTESQIISPELYSKSTQDKFAAAITECDDEGVVCVPAFYKGRIYFDFSRGEDYESQYESLLRWIVDKPRFVKPDLGRLPQHLASPDAPQLSTEPKFRRAREALREGAGNARGLFQEFCDIFSSELEKLRIQRAEDVEFDEQVVASYKAARPYLDQLFHLVRAICRFSNDPMYAEQIARLLEAVARYMFRPESISSWNAWDFDNFKLIAHSAFLGCLAVALQDERFDVATSLLGRRYLVQSEAGGARGSQGYYLFLQPAESLEHRNGRLNLRRQSLHADLIKETFSHGTLSLETVLQADFVAYLRSVRFTDEDRWGWYPVSLMWASARSRPFEIFARSESKRYFNGVRT